MTDSSGHQEHIYISKNWINPTEGSYHSFIYQQVLCHFAFCSSAKISAAMNRRTILWHKIQSIPITSESPNSTLHHEHRLHPWIVVLFTVSDDQEYGPWWSWWKRWSLSSQRQGREDLGKYWEIPYFGPGFRENSSFNANTLCHFSLPYEFLTYRLISVNRQEL